MSQAESPKARITTPITISTNIGPLLPSAATFTSSNRDTSLHMNGEHNTSQAKGEWAAPNATAQDTQSEKVTLPAQ